MGGNSQDIKARRRQPWLVAAWVLVVAGGCRRPVPVPVQPDRDLTLAVSPWPGSAAVYVAHDKGFFRDEGLNVTLQSHPSGHLALDAVLAGTADVCTASETPLARAVVEGKPIRILATLCQVARPILIIARRDRGIAAVDDLRGKRIGLTSQTAADFYVHVYLTISRIALDAVTLVDLPTALLAEALAAGEVDAVATWAPVTTAAQDALAANAVVLCDEELYTLRWNLVARADFAANHPQDAVRLMRAIVRANDFIDDDTTETAIALVARHIGMDVAAVREEWPNYRMEASLKQDLILGLEDEARWLMQPSGGPGELPNVLDFIYVDALAGARPAAVRIPGRRGSPP